MRCLSAFAGCATLRAPFSKCHGDGPFLVVGAFIARTRVRSRNAMSSASLPAGIRGAVRELVPFCVSAAY